MRIATLVYPDDSLGTGFCVHGHWVRPSVAGVKLNDYDEIDREKIQTLVKNAGGLSEIDVQRAVRDGNAVPEKQASLRNPLPRGGKIVAVGMNYLDHIAEIGAEVPQEPFIFGKYRSSITGPFSDVVIDFDLVSQPDYEVELGVVIGTACRDIPADQAPGVVAGYVIANDVSSRNVQFSQAQWIRSKSFDDFCPVGPWLTTADDIPDPQNLALWSTVNGEQRQKSTTNQMLFSVAELIAYCSRGTTLHPGDLLLTGTPPGVAMGMPETPWLQSGDVVECGIDGLGTIRNRIAARAAENKGVKL